MSDDIMKQAAEAVVEVKKGFEAYKEANDARLKEIEAKGAADPLLEQKLAKIDEALNAANETAEKAFLAVKRSQRVITDEKGNEIDLDAKAQQWANITATAYEQRPFDMNAKSMAEYKAAGLTYLRKGDNALTPEERKALSVGFDPSGGYVVYPDMSGQIVT
jgi:HK97 family phage major capsid protein